MTDVKPQDHWTVVGAIKAARALIKAADDLSFAAQITGGTAGRDEALCLAVIHWAAERDKQKQVLRIIELEGHDPEVGVGYELCPMPKPQADHSEDILHMVTPRDRALRPAQSPPKQSELYPMPNETGWLIELPHTGKNGGRLCWVTLKDKNIDRFRTVREGEDYDFQEREFPLEFTPDSNKALRFARKEDAELFMRVFDRFLLLAVVTEHQWINQKQAHAD